MNAPLPADLVGRLIEHADECEGVAKERAQTENLHYMNTCDYAYALAFRSAADEIKLLARELAEVRAELGTLQPWRTSTRPREHE